MADLTGIGAVADLAGTVIGKIWPDKSAAEQQQLAAAVALVQGQLEINKVEAQSSSWFIAGGRPFIVWVCGTAFAWNWVGLPIAQFITTYIGHPVSITSADMSEMMPVLLGLLGLSGFRTYEKVKGVAS